MSKSTISLTTTEYAKKCNKSRQSIHKAASKNKIHLLPGVKKITRVGIYYFLEVSATFSFSAT